MINVEYRIFQFSNGCVVQAYMGYFVCNNQRFPLVGITMQARQGMISLIKKTLKLNDRVKVIKECYFCSFTPSNSSQKINFQAEPKSAKHISLVVSVDKIGIFKGDVNISFDSIHSMQEVAFQKFTDYKSRVARTTQVSQSTSDLSLGQAIKTGMTKSTGITKDSIISSNGVLTTKFKEGYHKGVQIQSTPKQPKAAEVVTKFSEDSKTKLDKKLDSNKAYKKLGISDENAARGKMSPTNYLLEGLFGKTPKGIKPPVNSMSACVKEKK